MKLGMNYKLLMPMSKGKSRRKDLWVKRWSVVHIRACRKCQISGEHQRRNCELSFWRNVLQSDLWLGIKIKVLLAGLLVITPYFNNNPTATCKFKQDRYFPGSRCFSSSNQFVTTMILRGPAAADAVASGSFIIRNRLPSGLMSQLLAIGRLGT
jgi:hypothetical protein